MNQSDETEIKDAPLKQRILSVLYLVAFIIAIHVVNSLTGYSLNSYGIEPRSFSGLFGILFCPFLHADYHHLIMNSLPLAVLGAFVILRGSKEFLRASAFIVIVGGAGVWIAGRPSIHIGASGLVFGYFGYLLARGWYIRDIISIIFAIITLVLYGGLIFGVFPSLRNHISWEGHLFGLIAGILAVRVFVDKKDSKCG